MSEKTVLDREDVRRTLVRIAHEIVESTGGEGVAVVGIHRRGAVLGARLRDPVAELVGEPVPLGDIDISFYRDDVGIRGADYQPIVHSTHIDFPVEDTTVVLVDDVLYTGRTVRAAIDVSSTTADRAACSSRCWPTADTASSRSARTTWTRTFRPPGARG